MKDNQKKWKSDEEQKAEKEANRLPDDAEIDVDVERQDTNHDEVLDQMGREKSRVFEEVSSAAEKQRGDAQADEEGAEAEEPVGQASDGEGTGNGQAEEEEAEEESAKVEKS
jgi:hypothetical protein